jgi:hypothetical protein
VAPTVKNHKGRFKCRRWLGFLPVERAVPRIGQQHIIIQSDESLRRNFTTYQRQNPFPTISKKYFVSLSLMLTIRCLFTWINLSRMLSGELEDSVSSRFIPSNERHRIFLFLIMKNDTTVICIPSFTVGPSGSIISNDAALDRTWTAV